MTVCVKMIMKVPLDDVSKDMKENQGKPWHRQEPGIHLYEYQKALCTLPIYQDDILCFDPCS